MPEETTQVATTPSGTSGAQIREDKNAEIKSAILRSLAAGCSVTLACGEANISRKTFYEWLKVDKEFARAVKESDMAAVKAVEDALFVGALQGRTANQIFFLTNRAPDRWKNTQRVEVNNYEKMDRNELMKELQDIEKMAKHVPVQEAEFRDVTPAGIVPTAAAPTETAPASLPTTEVAAGPNTEENHEQERPTEDTGWGAPEPPVAREDTDDGDRPTAPPTSL